MRNPPDITATDLQFKPHHPQTTLLLVKHKSWGTFPSNHNLKDDPEPLYSFDILPVEILSAILLSATYAHEDHLTQYRSPSVLCRVSRHWRAVAFMTPRIWSLVSIRDECTLGHAQDRVSRAGGVPMNIIIDDPSASLKPEMVLMWLLPQCDRWVSLQMNVSSVESYTTLLPETLPLLRNLSFEDNGNEFTMKTSLPRLDCMKLTGCWLCWDPSFVFGSLTRFHAFSSDKAVDLPIKTLLDFLRNAPNLEVLELNESWIFERPTTNESLLVLFSHAVELSKLETMRLDGLLPWEVILFLSCVRTPNLRRLMLSIHPGAFGENSPSLLQPDSFNFNVPSVRELTLGPFTMKDQAKQILVQMEHIHTLSIIGTGNIPHDTITSLLTGPILPALPERLSEIYIRDIPMAKLHKVLYDGPLSMESKSLLRRIRWKIRPTEIEDKGVDAVNQERKLIGELHAMMTNLEITEENQWWD